MKKKFCHQSCSSYSIVGSGPETSGAHGHLAWAKQDPVPPQCHAALHGPGPPIPHRWDSQGQQLLGAAFFDFTPSRSHSPVPERAPLAPPMRNSRQHLESEFYGRMRHKMPQGCHVPSLNSKHDGFQIHGLVSQHRQMLGLGNPRALGHCAQKNWLTSCFRGWQAKKQCGRSLGELP